MWKSKLNSKSTTNFNNLIFIFTLLHLNPKNIFQSSSVILLAEGKSIPKVLTDISVNLGSERHRSQDKTQFCFTNTHVQRNYQSLPSTATIVSESKRLARQHKGSLFGSRLLCEVSLKVKLLKDERPYRTICLYRDYIDLGIFEKGVTVQVEKVTLRVEQIYKDLQPVKGFILNEPNSVVQGYLVKKQFYGSIRMYDKYRLYHIAFYIEPISSVQMYNHNPNFNFAQSNNPGGSKSKENAVLFEYISTLEKSEWVPCAKIENQIQAPRVIISLNPETTTTAETNGTTLKLITSTIETNTLTTETNTSYSDTLNTTETDATAEIESNLTLTTPVTSFLRTSDFEISPEFTFLAETTREKLNLTAFTTTQANFSVTANRTKHITPAPTPFNISLSTEVTLPESSRRKTIEPIHSTTKESVVAVKLGITAKSKSKPTKKATKKPVHPFRSISSSNLPDSRHHSTVITATTKKFYSTIKLGNKIPEYPEAHSHSFQKTTLGKSRGISADVLQKGDIKETKAQKKKRKCKTRKKDLKLSTEILSFRMSTEKWNPDDPEYLSRLKLLQNKTSQTLRSNTKLFNENYSSKKSTVKNEPTSTMRPTTDILHSTIATTRKVPVLKITKFTKPVKANGTATKKASAVTIGAEGFKVSTEHPTVPVKHSTVQQNKVNFIRARHAKQITNTNSNNSATVHYVTPHNITSYILTEDTSASHYLSDSDSSPGTVATTVTAAATAELDYCEEEDAWERVSFSSEPTSSADKLGSDEDARQFPVSDLSFSTEVPSPKPIHTTRVTVKFRASTDMDEDDSMGNIGASKDVSKTQDSGGLTIFIPSTDIMEGIGVASSNAATIISKLPTNINTTKTEIKVPTNINATNTGIKGPTGTGIQVPTNINATNTELKVPTNTGIQVLTNINATNTGIKVPTNINATNTGIQVPTNINATNTGIKVPSNINATNTGIKVPSNINATNTGIQVPTNINATNTGIKVPTNTGIQAPTNTNATNTGIQVPTNMNGTNKGIKMPTSTNVTNTGMKIPTNTNNTTKTETNVPINKNPATTETKTTTTTTTTTTKTTTKLTTTTTFYPTNFVLSTEKSVPPTLEKAPFHSTDVTWPDGINPDESSPYHSSDPRVKSRKPTKPMHSTVRDTTGTTKSFLGHSTGPPGARRNTTLKKKKKKRKTTFMPFMMHSTAVNKLPERQRTDGIKAVSSLKGRLPVHSSQPPGARRTSTFKKTRITTTTARIPPVHSSQPPPRARTTRTFNKAPVMSERNLVHSSEPPGVGIKTTAKKKKKKKTTTFLRHSTAVTALTQRNDGIMGKAVSILEIVTEHSLEPKPGQTIYTDIKISAPSKINLDYYDDKTLESIAEPIFDPVLIKQKLKQMKLSTENIYDAELLSLENDDNFTYPVEILPDLILDFETDTDLKDVEETSPNLVLLPKASPAPDLVLPQLETDQYLVLLPETSPAPAPVPALVVIRETDPYLILIPETSPDLIVRPPRPETTRIKLKATSTWPLIDMRKTRGIGRFFPLIKNKNSSPTPSVQKTNVVYVQKEDFIARSINNSFLVIEKLKKLKISTNSPQDVEMSLEEEDDFSYPLENSPDFKYPKLLIQPLLGRNLRLEALLPDERDTAPQSQESNRENVPSLNNKSVNNSILLPLLEIVKRVKLSTISNHDSEREPEPEISLENESDLKYVHESVPNLKLNLKSGRYLDNLKKNNPYLNFKVENDRYVKPSLLEKSDLVLTQAQLNGSSSEPELSHALNNNQNLQLLPSDDDVQLGQNLQEPKNNVLDSPIPSDNDILDQEIEKFISLEDNTEIHKPIIQRRRRNANAIDFKNFFGDDAAVNEEDVLEGLEFSDGKTESVVFDLRRDSALVCQLCIWIQPFFAETFGLGGSISNGIAEVVDIIKFTDWIYRTIDFNHDGFQENIGFSIKKILLSDKINFDIDANSIINKNVRRKRASNLNSKIKMYPQAHRHDDYNYLKESPGDSLAQLMQKFKEIDQDSDDFVNLDQNDVDLIYNKNQEERRKKRFNFEIYVNEMYEKDPDVLYANRNGQQTKEKGADKFSSKENIEDILTKFSRDITKFPPIIALNTLKVQLLDWFHDDNCCTILGFIFHDLAPDFSATTKRSVCSENNVGIISGYFGNQKISKFDVFRGVMHTLGHMFGASHDSISGSEFDDKTFTDFLNPFPLHPLQQLNVGLRPNSFTYSSLAKDQMTMFLDSSSADCLTKKSVHSYCGDGILDDGEECDCGTPWQCEQTSSCCGERQSFVGCKIIIPGKKRCSRKAYGK